MLDRGSFTPQEVVAGLKEGQGVPAARILAITGHEVTEIAKYTPEDRDYMAALELGISTAEVKLLNGLISREVERDMPDVLQTAIEQPEAIFGRNYPLLRVFGRLIDGYSASDWRRMLRSHRGDIAGAKDHSDVGWSFVSSTPEGWTSRAREGVSVTTQDAFGSAARDALERAGTKYDDIARPFPLTNDAGMAASEIQAATYSGYHPRYLQHFRDRNLAPLTVEALKIEATRGAYRAQQPQPASQ